jgi:hypothetical protein
VQAVLPHKNLVFDKKIPGLLDDVYRHPLPLLSRLTGEGTISTPPIRRTAQ